MNQLAPSWPIRAVAIHEAAAIADVVRAAFRDVALRFGLTPENCPRHPSNCQPEWIASAIAKGSQFFVVERDGRLCASVGMGPPVDGTCELVRLAVRPEYRRMGVGEALVRHVLAQASAAGLARVELAIIAKHDDLRRWYEKRGFRCDRVATFPSLPFEVAFLSAPLAQPPASDLHAVLRHKQAVLFDLFHTLAAVEIACPPDSPRSHELLGVTAEAWSRAHHAPCTPRLLGQIRDPVAIVQLLAHGIDPTIPMARIRRASESRAARFAMALRHVPQDAINMLSALRASGKRLALVSNADVAEMAGWSESPLRPLFDTAVFSCDIGIAKPDPGIYRMAMEQLKVHPRDCAFVGDGGSDELRAARELGITTIMFTGIVARFWPAVIPPRRQYADFEIEHYSQLLPRNP